MAALSGIGCVDLFGGGGGCTRVRLMSNGWVRLGEHVAAERGRRFKSRAAFARHAGIATRVVDDIEKGRRSNYSESTIGALEAALGWQHGSAQRVVQGGRPRREVDPVLSRMLELWPALSPDTRVMLVDLAERALGANRE